MMKTREPSSGPKIDARDHRVHVIGLGAHRAEPLGN